MKTNVRRFITILEICAVHIGCGYGIYEFLSGAGRLYGTPFYYTLWIPFCLGAYMVSDIIVEDRHPRLDECIRCAICGVFTACLVLFCIIAILFTAKGAS